MQKCTNQTSFQSGWDISNKNLCMFKFGYYVFTFHFLDWFNPSHNSVFSYFFRYESAHSARHLNLALFSRLAFVDMRVWKHNNNQSKDWIYRSPVKFSVKLKLQKQQHETRNRILEEKWEKSNLFHGFSGNSFYKHELKNLYQKFW